MFAALMRKGAKARTQHILAVRGGSTAVSAPSHLALGRLTLDRSAGTSRDQEASNYELDLSDWLASSGDTFLRSSPSQRRSDDSPRALLTSLRTRLRVRNPPSVQTEIIDEEESDAQISPQVLAEVIKPVVDSEIWSQLTGHEFDSPETVQAFARTGLNIGTSASNEWVEWKAQDKVTSFLESETNSEEEKMAALRADTILVYSGKWKKPGYGSHLPIIKTQAIINMSPFEMARLLLDSSRVKTYNKMSLGRNDIRILQRPSENGDYCETKIVCNLTQPPMVKRQMRSVTLMHGQALPPEDGGGYLVVSRAVPEPGGDGDFIKSEILLGINVLRPLEDNPDRCLVTAATHVYSSSLPTIAAKSVGISSAINFVKDVRHVCTPKAAQ